jgi:hypothetical protein
VADGSLQGRLDLLIDGILDLLAESVQTGEELDPLASIVSRLQARGDTIDLDDAPPMMRMLLGGMLG